MSLGVFLVDGLVVEPISLRDQIPVYLVRYPCHVIAGDRIVVGDREHFVRHCMKFNDEEEIRNFVDAAA